MQLNKCTKIDFFGLRIGAGMSIGDILHTIMKIRKVGNFSFYSLVVSGVFCNFANEIRR
jgi:hypothetical protein